MANEASQVQYNSTYSGLGSLQSFQVNLKNVDNSISIDITSLVLDFSIYEDIFSKTLYGDVTIKDAVNLLNGEKQGPTIDGFPIVGEEYIEVRYSIVGQDQVFRRFSVYSIKNIHIESSLKVRNYILQFCSEENLLDSTTLIQKSYQSPISDMVKDVLENYLNVNSTVAGGKQKKIYNIQITKGQQNIVVPKLSPLETLDLFARRSIAEKYFTSASYLFFENKNGFNFCDIEYLIQNGRQTRTKNPEIYTYYYENPNIAKEPGTIRRADASNISQGYKTIISMIQKHKFDTIEKIKRGYFESEIFVFDMYNRELKTSVYKFLDKYKDTNALGNPKEGSNLVYPENSLDFIKSVTSEPSTPPKKKSIFDFTKSTNPAPGKFTKTFLIPKDSRQPETYLEDIYPNRASYMTRLAQNMYTADVYGDTAIGAGDLIYIELPEIIGTTSAQLHDRFLSGYFLITSIHHKFTPDSYLCTYDLFKNGFSEPVITGDSEDKTDPANAFATEIDLKSISITNAVANTGI